MEHQGTGMESRAAGLDLVRTLAAISVVAVHFFLNCGYYGMPMEGRRMFLLTALRWLLMVCVPLFMLLTGYLKINKKPDEKHYRGLIPIMEGYLVISAIKMLVDNAVYGKIYTLREGVRALFDYRMSWYTAMYVGMMLLIPFLNVLWRGLSQKRHRRLLILSLLCLTALPSVLPYVTPSYWQALYPVTYYYIGAYIRSEQPRLDRKAAVWAAGGILLILLAETAGSFHFSQGGAFSWDFLGKVDSGYGSLPVCICAVLVFLLFYRTEVKSTNIRRLLMDVSGVSFYIYLFSGMFDTVIYQKLSVILMKPENYLIWFPPAVAMSFLGSFALARILDKGLKTLTAALLPAPKETIDE